MFKRSFTKFLKESKHKDEEEIYPYLYSINFKELKQAKQELKVEPIRCSSCGAVLTDVNDIKEDPKIGVHFKCAYCDTINVISRDLIPTKLDNDMDFIVEDVKPKEEKDDKVTGAGAGAGELYIALIDISGSMSGQKIAAVKKSLVQTLKDYKINAATIKFLLIAFESSVYYYMRHDKNAIRFSGDILYSVEGMKSSLQGSIEKDTSPGSIGEFADGWIKVVENLNSMDMTALGPALYFAILSFQSFQFKSGRITLLTDGLANQGIGNLSGTSPGAENFYEEMAALCNQNEIVVDVVGVSSSGDKNEMGLQVLGKLTDNTGGKMFLISSEEMESIFTEIRQTNYIGRDVNVKIITPKSVGIKNITGAFSSKSVQESEVNLGAITADRELFVELDSGKGFGEEMEVPVQLQVEYKDAEGRRRLRIVNDKVKITSDEKEFKTQYDQKLNVMMNIQSAGSSTYSGKAGASKDSLKNLKKKIQNEMEILKQEDAPFAAEAEFSESLSYIDDELEEMEEEEKKAAAGPKASFMATIGQAKSRMSTDELQKRIAKKKNQ